MAEFLRRAKGLRTPLLLIGLTLAMTGVAFTFGDAPLRRIALGALVSMIAVIGMYAFIGLTGVFSFGQLGFMAIGAYTTALLTLPVATKRALFSVMPRALVELHAPFLVAVLIGGALAALVALALSIPMSRMPPLGAGLATLAVLVAVYVVAGNWTAITNGSKGITAIPTGTTLTVLMIAVSLVILAVWFFQESAVGMRIRAGREDDVAARSIGIRVGRARGLAFVVSALIMGIAGGLYAQLQGNLSPDAFFLDQTFLLVAMLVVGGMTTLSGAVLGTILVTAYRRVLQVVESGLDIGPLQLPGRPGLTEVGLGVALLIVLAVRPTGLTRGREITSFGHLPSWSGLGRRRIGRPKEQRNPA